MRRLGLSSGATAIPVLRHPSGAWSGHAASGGSCARGYEAPNWFTTIAIIIVGFAALGLVESATVLLNLAAAVTVALATATATAGAVASASAFTSPSTSASASIAIATATATAAARSGSDGRISMPMAKLTSTVVTTAASATLLYAIGAVSVGPTACTGCWATP